MTCLLSACTCCHRVSRFRHDLPKSLTSCLYLRVCKLGDSLTQPPVVHPCCYAPTGSVASGHDRPASLTGCSA